MAHAGSKVILIDADLRNPSLSRLLANKVELGLVEVLNGQASLRECLRTDEVSGVHFLSAGGTAKLLHTNEVLRSVEAKRLMTALRENYDYVILDLPPLAPVVDARTTTAFVDAYIYVVEWGATKIDVVEHTLADAQEIYERLLGVILNKADMAVLGRYERYRSNYYYKKYYSRYGYTS
jgi:succinoglycan biosynthesis transport protein ExoP